MYILMSLLILFCIYQNIILSLFPHFDFIGYWDEFCTFLFIFIFIILKLVNLHRRYDIADVKINKKILQCTLGIVFLGVLSNFIFGYAYNVNAIIRDIVGFIKFPITFLVTREIGFDKKGKYCVEKYCMPIFKFMSWVLCICSILSLFHDFGMSQNEMRHGVKPFQFFFIHPTYLVQSAALTLIIMNSVLKKSKSIIYDVLLIIPIILAMRTKGFAFVAIYVFIKYGGNWLKKIKVIYGILAISLVVFVGYDKINEYASWSSSPRECLYKGSLQLMGQCFPLGSGFATFASHVSGKFRSQVYDFIYIADGWINGQPTAALGDAGFPYYIGQFGILGTILFFIIMLLIFKSAGKENMMNVSIFSFFGLIIISLTSEAILVNNGFELGLLFAILVKMVLDNNKIDSFINSTEA